jgi:hypothetical protein
MRVMGLQGAGARRGDFSVRCGARAPGPQGHALIGFR